MAGPGLGRWALIAAACLVLGAFFLPALRRYSSTYYSPADITQTHSLTRVTPGHVPANELLSDLAVQMEPWLLFNKEELAAGRLPLWNPYNGGGTPHFANGQSAVFSPFSLPFYVLPFKAALLFTAALKLLVLGGFTYLFLRELGLYRISAFLGGVAFAFGGHNVLLLGYPHPAAAAALPACLYFIELAFQHFDAHGLPAPWALAGLCLSMTMGFLAGQPEPCFFAVGFSFLYAIARAVVSWRRKGGTRAVFVAIAPRLLRVFAAAVIAVGITAFQTLPFLEYLRESRLLEQRTGVQTPLLSSTWPLQFFPSLLGNPSTGYYLHPSLPPPDFETTNLAYAGALTLLLAAFSFLFARRHWAHGFFAAVSVLWLAYAYDILGAGRILGLIPGLHIAPINRSQAIWLFALAVCAAFALQRALESDRRRLGLAATGVVAALGLIVVARWGALRLLPVAYRFAEQFLGQRTFDPVASRADALAHVDELTALFAFGAACFALLWCFQNAWIRGSLAVGVVVAAYLGTGNLFKEYNPLCENSHFFPVTPSIEVLQRKVGHDRLVILGEDTLPPDTNMAYGLRLISSYDGLWIRRYDRLFRAMFGESNNWRNTLHGTARGLRLFGVDWVLSKDEWIPIGTLFPDVPMERRRMGPIGELVPGAPVAQSFTPTLPRMQAIRLLATTHGRRLDGLALWTLEDAATGEQLLNGTVECRDYWTVADEPLSVILRFDEPLNVAGRAMTLRLEAPDAQPGRALSLFARRDADGYVNLALWRATNLRALTPELSIDNTVPHPDLGSWRLDRGGERLEGQLCLDVSYALNDFELAESLPPFDLFRYKRGLTRWHTVTRAVAAESEERAFALTVAPTLDVATTVVLEGADPAEVKAAAELPEESAPVNVLVDLATRKRFEVTRRSPGWLVLTTPWFPGWKARVNGRDQQVLHANYAFGAVRIGAGTSTIDFVYDPDSLRIGGWISLACLGAGVLLVGGLVLIRRRGLAAMARSPGSG
jgi:hypothetical protein